jgi:hypothetical protein
MKGLSEHGERSLIEIDEHTTVSSRTNANEGHDKHRPRCLDCHHKLDMAR